MKLLFICNQNQNRSKTAEHLYKDRFETRSAGLFNENPVTEQQMSWADTIIVMDHAQRAELSRRFPKQYLQKRILSLDVPDIYSYDQPELKRILQAKIDLAISEIG
ncbi:MAG: phosphotyrosine protein phosphatase [Nanoarchaeota archaeon]|nr:phosphotyrosine protein phosphatase [Nanoarchaeota archaeon]MBU1704501.1 phosphotyrosine protein phosphatase [Nanoarchaeota archaeon]